MRRKEVADAIRPWGLKPKKVIRVRAAFQVRTSQGTYCLKEVADSEKRLLFYDSVLRYVQSRGFTMLAPYIPTLTGECFAMYNGVKVVVLPWLEGREISYTSVQDIGAAAEALARFHKAAEGYQPEEGIQVKDKLGKWPEKLMRKVADLEMYCEQAKQGDTEFDRYFLQYAEWIYHHTVNAAQRIRQSPYYEQVEESRARLTICHGDPSKRNFIRDRQGQMHLIDFESMKSDLPILDFWRLLRRTLARDMWDFAKVKQIIDAYNRGRALSREEYELLGIFLTFPEKIWRIVHNYYEPSKKQGWTMKRFIRHLSRQLEQIGKMEQFLAEYHAAFIQGAPEQAGELEEVGAKEEQVMQETVESGESEVEVVGNKGNEGVEREEEVVWNKEGERVDREEKVVLNKGNVGVEREEEVALNKESDGLEREEEVVWNKEDEGLEREEGVVWNREDDGLEREEEVALNKADEGSVEESEALNGANLELMREDATISDLEDEDVEDTSFDRIGEGMQGEENSCMIHEGDTLQMEIDDSIDPLEVLGAEADRYIIKED